MKSGSMLPLLQPLLMPLLMPVSYPTGGASPSFDPATLFAGGVQGGWWDISDLSSLRQNSDGTGAVAVGDPVGYIADKSGNGMHMIQPTAAARPLLQQDINGNYRVEYDGVDDTLFVNASQSLFRFLHDGTGGTAYHGLSVESDAVNTNTLGDSVNNGQTGFRFTRVAASDSARVEIRNNTGAVTVIALQSAPSVWPINTPLILGYAYRTQTGDDARLYLNGAEVATAAEAGTPDTGNSGRTLGMPMTATLASRWYGGLAIAKELTTQEREDYEAYLAARCGVTL